MATYTPKPIDTSTVLLNNAQRRLIEQLVKKRVEDGWQHGPARNDQIKAHPSLDPYDELPDSEKDYDRVMVEQVIRAVERLLPYRRFARSGAVGARARRSRVSRACVGQKGRSGISHNDEVVDAILALVRSTLGLNHRVELR